MANSIFTPSNFQTPVPDATVDTAGLVSTTAQTFAGVKTFQDGAIIAGVTDGSTGASTSVGYLVPGSRLAASALTLTSNTAADVCAISVPAGEWLLNGWLGLKGTATSVSVVIAAYGTGAGALPAEQDRLLQFISTVNISTGNLILPLPGINISRTGASADYNLRVYVTFSGGTCLAYGAISARRMR